MKYTFLFLLLFLAYSCTDGEKEMAVDTIVINPEEATEEANTDDMLVADDCDMILLADTEKPISHIGKVISDADRLYVLDDQSMILHTFDSNGKLLFSIDRHGHASNEYLRLADFCILNGEILLLDLDARKILVCDSTGSHKRNIPITNIWGNGIGTLDNDIAIINEGSSPEEGSFHSFVIDNYGNILAKYIEFPPETNSCSLKVFAQATADELYYNNAPVNNIFSVRKDSSIPVLDIDFGKYTLPEKYHNYDLIQLMKDKLDVRYIPGIHEVFGNSKYIVLTYYFNNDKRWIVYNRESKEVIKHTKSLNISSMFQIGWGEYDICGDNLYVIESADNFKFRQKYIMPKSELGPEYKKSLAKADSVLKPESNPVIFRYRLK